MSTIKDLACDVGLMPRTDDFQNFIKDVSDILEYGYSDDIDKDWIISLCETSQLTIAKDVLYECGDDPKSPRRTPAWWEVYYNEKVLKRSQQQSPHHKRRPAATQSSKKQRQPLPKGRQLQEKRRNMNERRVQRHNWNESRRSPPNKYRRRTMDLEFSHNTKRNRRERQAEQSPRFALDVPHWPGKSPSPRRRRRRRSPSPPPRYRRNNKRRRR